MKPAMRSSRFLAHHKADPVLPAPKSSPSCWVMDSLQHWPVGGHLLDYACGSGRHSTAIAARWPGRFAITAVDRDQDALALLDASSTDITTLCHDLEAAPWPFADQSFDIVLVTNYLYRPRLARLFALVRPGGYLVYETFASGHAAFGRPRNPDYLLEEGELAAHLPPDFDILDHVHGRVDTPKPAMIQHMLARRHPA